MKPPPNIERSCFETFSEKSRPVVMRLDIRLWTAIALIGICGFAVARGWEIVRFSLAMADVDSAEKQAEITSTWSDAPDVASAALRADLNNKIEFPIRSRPIGAVRCSR